MSKPKYYSGKVLSILFEDAKSAFYIVRMLLDGSNPGDEKPIAVKGNVPGLRIAEGVWFGFEARWVNHAQYGRQLQITKAPVFKDSFDPDTAAKILTAHGVGPLVVQNIRSHFGDGQFLEVLSDVESLSDVPGLSSLSAEHVVSRWRVAQAYFKTLNFLTDLGLPSSVVNKIWGHFGDDAEKVLSEDPWRLLEMSGVTLAHADSIANHLGLKDDEKRLRGVILCYVKGSQQSGNTYLSSGELYASTSRLFEEVTSQAFAAALVTLHKEGLVYVDTQTKPGTTAVYDPWMYGLEKQAAENLLQRKKLEPNYDFHRRLVSVGPKTEQVVLGGGSLREAATAAVAEWGEHSQIPLSEEQKTGVINALVAPVSILTGLPGTGKTTSLKAAVHILQDAEESFLLCAPTGIAAKNLSSKTGSEASTIHRAFSAKGIQTDETTERTYVGVQTTSSDDLEDSKETEWEYSQENPHPANVVIVDEASMLDQHLIYRLLECTKPTARIVFVGDDAQLPSVGPGNVLKDLKSSEQFPTVHLSRIFRQEKEDNGIVLAAHAIHAGRDPELNKEFRMFVMQDEDKILDAIVKIAEKFHEERLNFQVISPKHMGTLGVTNLNTYLRERLNPASAGREELKLGKDFVREGDRVMIIRNDYKLHVYNGDLGKVHSINKVSKEVEILIYGDPQIFIQIPFKDVGKMLVLAYACTVHKSQGLEYDRVVMPMVNSFFNQLQRNLLYTAITRAREQVVLLGHPTALSRAVRTTDQHQRQTFFQERLETGENVL